MEIKENHDLTKLNTFGVSARAKFFAEVESEKDIKELFISNIFKKNERLFLGGGSNTLFTKDFDGIVVLNRLKGIEVLSEDAEKVEIKAMGGEIWHELVDFCSMHGWWGIENLSLIPGTVGAAPMQNIGAYGAELKDALVLVEAYDVETGEKKDFKKEECDLGYRSSIFKNSVKGKYFISAIILRLSKTAKDNSSYKTLSEYLEKNKITVRGPKDISDAVAEIRRSKLPDPAKIGNAGSFFKNVFVTADELKRLQKDFPDIPYFKEGETIKIPSGWLIEQCGWKGKKVGKVGVHDRQALVLVNHGGATGAEIIELADEITHSVFEKFCLRLEKEVNIC